MQISQGQHIGINARHNSNTVKIAVVEIEGTRRADSVCAGTISIRIQRSRGGGGDSVPASRQRIGRGAGGEVLVKVPELRNGGQTLARGHEVSDIAGECGGIITVGDNVPAVLCGSGQTRERIVAVSQGHALDGGIVGIRSSLVIQVETAAETCPSQIGLVCGRHGGEILGFAAGRNLHKSDIIHVEGVGSRSGGDVAECDVIAVALVVGERHIKCLTVISGGQWDGPHHCEGGNVGRIGHHTHLQECKGTGGTCPCEEGDLQIVDVKDCRVNIRHDSVCIWIRVVEIETVSTAMGVCVVVISVRIAHRGS